MSKYIFEYWPSITSTTSTTLFSDSTMPITTVSWPAEIAAKRAWIGVLEPGEVALEELCDSIIAQHFAEQDAERVP